MDIISLILGVLKFANWLAHKVDEETWKADGRRQHWQKEVQELDRTMKVTDEEDARARTDTDSALTDELSRPL